MNSIPEWFVAFGDWGTNIWWHRLCKKGFRHVLAFGYDTSADVWIVFDTRAEALLLKTIPKTDLDYLVAGLWAVDARILRCKVQGKGPKRPRFLATCVTVVGHLIGLRRCAVFPYGLYRMLLASGAKPAFEKKHEVRIG